MEGEEEKFTHQILIEGEGEEEKFTHQILIEGEGKEEKFTHQILIEGEGKEERFTHQILIEGEGKEERFTHQILIEGEGKEERFSHQILIEEEGKEEKFTHQITDDGTGGGGAQEGRQDQVCVAIVNDLTLGLEIQTNDLLFTLSGFTKCMRLALMGKMFNHHQLTLFCMDVFCGFCKSRSTVNCLPYSFITVSM